jgi:hypothetical protein
LLASASAPADRTLTRSMLPSLGAATCTDATRKCGHCTQNQGVSRRSVPRPVPRRGISPPPPAGFCADPVHEPVYRGSRRTGLPLMFHQLEILFHDLMRCRSEPPLLADAGSYEASVSTRQGGPQ